MGDIFSLLSALFWAAANVTIGMGIRSGEGKGVDNGAFLSILLTALLSALMWLPTRTELSWSGPTRTGVLWFAVAGALTIFVGRVLLYSSIRSLGAMRAASLKRLVPLFSVLLGALLLDEAIGRLLMIGMAFIFGGFVLLLLESMARSRPARADADAAVVPADRPAAVALRVGLAYGVVSAIAYAAGNIARKHGVIQLPEPALGAMLGALVGAAMFVATGAFAASYREAVRGTFARFNRWQFAGGVLGSVGQILFFLAIDHSTVSRAAMIVSTEVFLTILLSVLLVRDHEKVTLAVIGAAVLGAVGTIVILADRP